VSIATGGIIVHETNKMCRFWPPLIDEKLRNTAAKPLTFASFHPGQLNIVDPIHSAITIYNGQCSIHIIVNAIIPASATE
jgi:hypothetical protein